MLGAWWEGEGEGEGEGGAGGLGSVQYALEVREETEEVGRRVEETVMAVKVSGQTCGQHVVS